MSYQILGLRKYPAKNKTTGETTFKTFDAFHDRRWRFETLNDLYKDPAALIEKLNIPQDERFNLFYTTSYCGVGKREFAKLQALYFDIDGIDINKLDDYEAVFCEVLGVALIDVTVVFSGNGLHFILHLEEEIRDAEWFDQNRLQYKGVLKLLDAALERKLLPGKPDPAIFDHGRIIRLPNTINRKEGREERTAVLRRTSDKKHSIDLEKLSGIKRLSDTDAIPIRRYAKYRNPDGKAALEECGFLKHCQDEPNTISEPEWYAAASIIGRFNGGPALFHKVSSGHKSYSKQETDEKLEQALKASGPRTCRNIDALWGKCETCPLYQKIQSPVVIFGKDVIPSEATGFYDIISTKSGDKHIPNYNDLLAAYIRDHKFKAISDMKVVYIYNGTHYVEDTPWDIKGYSEQMFSPKPQEKMRNEFYAKVLVNNLARRDFFFESTQDKLNFKNGILDLKANVKYEHSPAYGFRTCLPYDYNPAATCPEWEKFIKQITCGDESLASILQEFVGYIVTGGEYKFNKALWLSGTGANGKSTFLNTVMDLIGHDAYSAVSIRSIINDKFASSALDGMLANFCEETSPEDLSDSGPFKNLTGDGTITAQKKYGDPYKFYNRAKIVMTYNEIPILKDLSAGMLRRPLVVPFNMRITDPKEMRKDLRETFKAELSGIFNWALRGERRLIEQGDFTFSQASVDALNVIKDESDNVAQWIKDNVEFFSNAGQGKEYSVASLFEIYKDNMGRYAYSKIKFAKRLKEHPRMSERYVNSNGDRRYERLAVNGKGSEAKEQALNTSDF